MARKRRTYTSEFKAEAVKLVTEQGYSVAEAARSLGLSDNLIRNWKQAYAQSTSRLTGCRWFPLARTQATRVIPFGPAPPPD